MSAPVLLALPVDFDPAGDASGMPPIHPRSRWGKSLPPLGPLTAEEDVRFLLVHHSASSNEYGAEDVPGILQGFFAMHTSAEKGWPDIAYNFLVDRYGGIWEGRAGSLDAPVRGDATGGSQGFALLCCFIGDLTAAPPTRRAARSMAALLAWLGRTHSVNLTPGATATFVSRGSNKWPEGARVVTPTIAAHRDMSLTTCPGDAGYAFVREDLPPLVAAATVASPPVTRPGRERAAPSGARPGGRRGRPRRHAKGQAAGETGGSAWPAWQKLGLAATLAAVIGHFFGGAHGSDGGRAWDRRAPQPGGPPASDNQPPPSRSGSAGAPGISGKRPAG